MSNSKIKNSLAENMQRFGTKNLSDLDKHKLALLSEQMPAAYAQAQRNQDIAKGNVASPTKQGALQVTTGKAKNDNTPVFMQDKYNVVTGRFRNPIPDSAAILIYNDGKSISYYGVDDPDEFKNWFNGYEWSTSSTPGADGKPMQTIYGKAGDSILYSYSIAEPGVIRSVKGSNKKDGLYDWNSAAWKQARTNFQAIGDLSTATVMKMFPGVDANKLLNNGSKVFSAFDQFARGLVSKITLKNPNYK